MLNVSKTELILKSISGDPGLYCAKSFDSFSYLNLSCFPCQLPSNGNPYDVIIVDQNFNDFRNLDKCLSDSGKIIGLCITDVQQFVSRFHSTQMFWWCDWIKSENIVVLRRWRQPSNKWSKQRSKSNETLMIYSEHGWGDIFHKIRYLNTILQAFDGKVLFETRDGISELIKENFDVELVARDVEFEPTYSFELCESDKLFGNMPSCDNYIVTPKQDLIADIGVAWDSHHLTFENKSVSPDVFSYFSHCNLLSLQKFTHQKQSEIPDFFIHKPIRNWLDTAKLINSVNVVISVDTSIAHLSGAIGKETHVLLNGVYRTPVDKNPSWYPSTTAWRQTNGWEEIFRQVLKRGIKL